jgi:hypothetical protein
MQGNNFLQNEGAGDTPEPRANVSDMAWYAA